jgi:hypothetical protein
MGLVLTHAIALLLALNPSAWGRPRVSRQAEIAELMRAIQAAGIEIVLLRVVHPRSAAQFKAGERRVILYQETWQRADRLLESLRHEGHHVAAYCRFGTPIQPLGSPIAAWARQAVARAGYQGRLQVVETEAWSASRIAGLTLELLGQYCQNSQMRP